MKPLKPDPGDVAVLSMITEEKAITTQIFRDHEISGHGPPVAAR